jgi:hypothetical protein
VIGLAPIRVCLKGRLLELLCIHGLLAWGQELAPGVGIAPTSPPLQGGANLPQLPGVLAHGHDLRTVIIGRPPSRTAGLTVFRLSAGRSAFELGDDG